MANLSGVRQFPFVVAKRLFVQVVEQMEGLNAHVGSVDTALQEAPEILAIVRVNVAINVCFGVVNYLMGELTRQSVVRLQSIRRCRTITLTL